MSTTNGPLSDVDEELRDGVKRALEESPEELREKLVEMGVIDQYVRHSDVDQEEPSINEAEELLLEFVETLQNPKSTEEIKQLIEAERPDLIEEYGSFKHRSWLSDKLSKLTKRGHIGKFRKGRTVYYTPESKEAVRRWALYNDKFEEDLSRSDADRVVADTSMNREAVIQAIRELQE